MQNVGQKGQEYNWLASEFFVMRLKCSYGSKIVDSDSSFGHGWVRPEILKIYMLYVGIV